MKLIKEALYESRMPDEEEDNDPPKDPDGGGGRY